MSADRTAVLAWALGTFHACAVALLLLLPLYPTGALGGLLGGLETATGLVIFVALWTTSVWTTRHALTGGAWISAEPGSRGAFFSEALRWGAATGMLFLAELGLILLVRTLIVAPGVLNPLGVLVTGVAAGTIGMIFAFVIGGVVGVTLGALDLVALLLARAILRQGR